MPGFTLGKAKPPSGPTTGGTPEHPQKIASVFFRKISVSKLLVHLEKMDARHKQLRYGAGRVVGLPTPPGYGTPSPPYAYIAYECEPPRRRRPSRIQEHGNKVKEHRLEHTRPRRATHSNYKIKSLIFIGCDYKARL